MKYSKLLFITFALLINSAAALSAEFIPYSKDNFEALQKQDRRIVLQYHASWCPICKRQKNVLDVLTKDPNLKNVEFVTANYDADKEVRKQYSVKGQSTLILFQGGKELKRSQGMTDATELADFLKKSFGTQTGSKFN
ncbi:MAG: thioredoxin family protein [Bdellovibrionia bacterium]